MRGILLSISGTYPFTRIKYAVVALCAIKTLDIAQEGITYRRKADGYIMGNELNLGKFIDGTDDVIENYEEAEDVYNNNNE